MVNLANAISENCESMYLPIIKEDLRFGMNF